VVFALLLLSPQLAAPRRVPARRPGNFHLLAQMKVTKANGLNSISIWPDIEVEQSSPLGTAYPLWSQ
jgi:hypothetical protein